MSYRTNRRDFMKVVGAAGAAAAMHPNALSGGQSTSPPPLQRPNIVYLFSDEHRYQSMGFTETPAVRTPNMARMAEEGTSFEHAISNNPVCVPHRCMLLTGMWCHRTGAVENSGGLAPWDRTLGHVFSEAGYATGYTGKWHAGANPQHAGFDWLMFWGNTNDHWNSWWRDANGSNQKHDYDQYNAVGMTDQALEFMAAKAGSQQPFFLMVAWNPPHAIFTDPPEDKKALYPDAAALPWRENVPDSKKENWWDNYQGYHAHITAIDEEIGRVRAKLEELGIANNTIVIYTSDHGSMMASNGLGNKRHPNEESCRVPFLVTGPGIPAGQVRQELFGTVDIFPTLCALAGIPIPEACDGQDFSNNILGRSRISDPQTQLLMHVAREGASKHLEEGQEPSHEWVATSSDALFYRGVRSKRYTYTINHAGEWQLFDNVEDPLWQNNLIDDPALESTRQELRAQLEGWLEKSEYPFLSDEHLAMDLPALILQQAVDRALEIPLHHVVTRLKLTPAQYQPLPALRTRYYDDRGFPRDQEVDGSPWHVASRRVASDIRNLLDAEQKTRFDEMIKQEDWYDGPLAAVSVQIHH